MATENWSAALKRPVPTREEERELIGKFQGGSRAALDELVERNSRGVLQIVREWRRAPGYDEDDLMVEGMMALVGAAERFDLEREVRFMTYAHWRIRQACQRWLENHCADVRVCGSGTVRRVMFSRECPQAIRNAMEPTRLSTLPDWQERGHGLSVEADDGTTRSDAWALLGKAPPREREVLAGRLEGRTLAEIGGKMGVSRERARQIEANALRRLRRCAGVDG